MSAKGGAMSNSRTQVSSTVERITPDRAARMLTANVRNRALRPAHVKALAAQMVSGDWYIAQPITFDDEGWLVDGQHRLSAVVASRVAVEMLVVRGVAAESFGAFDQGYLRSASDLYGMMGGTNTTKAASVAGSMIMRASSATGARQPRRIVAEYALKHREVIEHVISMTARLKYMTAAERAAFCNAISYYGQEHIDPLLQRLHEGVFTGHGDPMNTLNRWMIDKHTRRSGRKVRTPRHVAYSAAVLAINAAVDGRPLVVLKPNGQDFVEGGK